MNFLLSLKVLYYDEDNRYIKPNYFTASFGSAG